MAYGLLKVLGVPELSKWVKRIVWVHIGETRASCTPLASNHLRSRYHVICGQIGGCEATVWTRGLTLRGKKVRNSPINCQSCIKWCNICPGVLVDGHKSAKCLSSVLILITKAWFLIYANFPQHSSTCLFTLVMWQWGLFEKVVCINRSMILHFDYLSLSLRHSLGISMSIGSRLVIFAKLPP